MKKSSKFLFAYSYWDVIPVVAGLLHFFYLGFILMAFGHIPLWVSVLLGVLYAFSISWNVNGISHNFIHNAYFKSFTLNRMFSLLESVSMGFSQTMYEYVHRQHHMGNNDRINEHGTTVDWVSFYRHGKNGEPEHALSYTLLSFFRDDPQAIYKLIRRHSLWLANYAVFELAVVVSLIAMVLFLKWQAAIYFVVFMYLGHSLTAMNGYYEHFGANPSKPITWGVSCYNKFYNWIWFNNGYHAEHHYRPKHHWTKMHQLHESIKTQQLEAGVHVIAWPHPIGFMSHFKTLAAKQTLSAGNL